MNLQAETRSRISSPPPLAVHFLGNLLTFHARTADTDGAFSLIHCRTAPGAGSPLHKQTDTEAFLVTAGTYEFNLDGEIRVCGVGEFIHIRPDTVHAFRNCGDTEAAMYIINLPSGLHEGFFLSVGEHLASGTVEFPPMAAGMPDFGQIAATAAGFGITILPPQPH
jgi:quercetin dioxygenase-like cupin family protein